MHEFKSTADTLRVYNKMSLIRQCEEAIIREYAKDEIKTPVHLAIGMEGISVGVTHLLPPGTKVFDYYRCHGTYLALGGDLDKFFGELYGRTTGAHGGKAGSMHLTAPEHGLMATSGIVASTIPMAVGAAFAAKYRGSDAVTVVIFGDGAVEEGDFWEALNLACLHKLRVLFVCADNGLAAQTPTWARRGFKSISDVVSRFECAVKEADGSDVREVLDAMDGALRNLGFPMPVFLRFEWHRFMEHVGPNTDYHKGYRDRPANQDELDPVLKFRKWLVGHEFTCELLNRQDMQIARKVETSMAAAQAAPHPGETELLTWVFA